MAVNRDDLLRVGGCWVTLGEGARMPLAADAIEFAQDTFFDNVVSYAGDLVAVHRVIRLAGRIARDEANARGSREISAEDLSRAVEEIKRRIVDPRRWVSICIGCRGHERP